MAVLLVKLIEVFLEPLPDFVVIRITPLAALDPYTEAEVASFNTENVSISFKLIRLMSTSGIPSTTISGLALLTVPNPRISKEASFLPAIPEFCTADKPGTNPLKADDALGKARPVIFSAT